MIQKYFALDKNYILEKAQLDLEENLIIHLINFCKEYYLNHFNPLGIEDATIISIKSHETAYTSRLEEFYRHLAAVYRFNHGENQLEFLFDGNDHYNKYERDWNLTFKKWLVEFCAKPNFLRAVLELTVFYPEGHKSELAESRMKAFIHQYFSLKIYKYKGIVRKMA